MPWDFLDEIDRRYAFLKIVDGAIYSCQVGSIKPEREIYMHLLNRFNIDPRKSIFLDDRQENLNMAKQLDIEGVLVKPEAYHECLAALSELGIN